DQAETADHILLVAMFDEVRAGVLIVGLNRVEESFQRDVVIDERLLIDDDLILLNISAKTEDVGDARHGAQLQLHNPILNRAQLLIALPVTHDLIEIDLARAGRDWPHRRFKTGGDVFFGISETLKDLFSSKINISIVAEINRDDGEAEF